MTMSANIQSNNDAQQTEVRDHWVQTPQGRIFVREWTPVGQNPAATPTLAPIIMFHDSLGAVSLWRDFPQALSAATGRTVYAYDRLGFGQSDARSDQPSLHFVSEEASKYFPKLREQLGIGHFVVLGHSVGGGMAVCSAAASPDDCDAVITIGAQAFVEECTKQGIREAQSLYSDPTPFSRLARYHGDKTRWVLDAWIESWLHPDFADWSVKEQLAQLRSPTLAIHGELDEYGSAVQPEIISGLSGGKPSRMVLLKGLGHVPYREDQALVVSHIADFLREHAAR